MINNTQASNFSQLDNISSLGGTVAEGLASANNAGGLGVGSIVAGAGGVALLGVAGYVAYKHRDRWLPIVYSTGAATWRWMRNYVVPGMRDRWTSLKNAAMNRAVPRLIQEAKIAQASLSLIQKGRHATKQQAAAEHMLKQLNETMNRVNEIHGWAERADNLDPGIRNAIQAAHNQATAFATSGQQACIRLAAHRDALLPQIEAARLNLRDPAQRDPIVAQIDNRNQQIDTELGNVKSALTQLIQQSATAIGEQSRVLQGLKYKDPNRSRERTSTQQLVQFCTDVLDGKYPRGLPLTATVVGAVGLSCAPLTTGCIAAALAALRFSGMWQKGQEAADRLREESSYVPVDFSRMLYPIGSTASKVVLSPVVGYTYHRQDDIPYGVAPAGLDATYKRFQSSLELILHRAALVNLIPARIADEYDERMLFGQNAVELFQNARLPKEKAEAVARIVAALRKAKTGSLNDRELTSRRLQQFFQDFQCLAKGGFPKEILPESQTRIRELLVLIAIKMRYLGEASTMDFMYENLTALYPELGVGGIAQIKVDQVMHKLVSLISRRDPNHQVVCGNWSQLTSESPNKTCKYVIATIGREDQVAPECRERFQVGETVTIGKTRYDVEEVFANEEDGSFLIDLEREGAFGHYDGTQWIRRNRPSINARSVNTLVLRPKRGWFS